MISNVDKNIILIKNIPSNMIEEAIFILKENVSDKFEDAKMELAKSESELILQNYIDGEIDASLKKKASEDKKKEKLKKVIVSIGIIFIIAILLLNRIQTY